MLKLIITISLLLLSASSYSQTELHRGENLLQPMTVPGENWQVSQSTDSDSRSMRWSNLETGESLTTRIIDGGGGSVDRFREINDQTGQNHCREFVSETVLVDETNGYDRMAWLASCIQEQQSFTVLHQYISGRDSSYYLTKRWSDSPEESEVEVWKSYFETVSVCDTRRRRRAPCPELSSTNGN
jgi:hypothetical protein